MIFISEKRCGIIDGSSFVRNVIERTVLMPQLGLHMISGIFVGRLFKRTIRIFSAGIFFGCILPDMDFLLVIPIRFIDRFFSYQFHRSFSHSLLFIIVLFLTSIILRYTGKKDAERLFQGLSLGVLLHIFLDLFMWFGTVQFFWPLNFRLNLFGSYTPPESVKMVLSSLELFCYGVFLLAASKTVRLPRGSRAAGLMMCITTLPLILISSRFNAADFELISYSAAIILGFIPSVLILRKPLLRYYGIMREKEYVTEKL